MKKKTTTPDQPSATYCPEDIPEGRTASEPELDFSDWEQVEGADNSTALPPAFVSAIAAAAANAVTPQFNAATARAEA